MLKSPPSSAQANLEVILASSIFSPSPKCRDFLRFVVLETLAGRGEFLKERTIAAEVFGKGVNFEPGEDSIVRVRAREVRKRLDEFYANNPDFPVRIDLPVGGYIPRILITESGPPVLPDAPVVPSPPTVEAPITEFPGSTPPAEKSSGWSRRRLLAAGATVAAAASFYPLKRELQDTSLDRLWKPVFATGKPLIISIPILTTDTGEITDRVGLGAARAATEVVAFIARHKYPYEVRFGEVKRWSWRESLPDARAHSLEVTLTRVDYSSGPMLRASWDRHPASVWYRPRRDTMGRRMILQNRGKPLIR